MGKMQKTCGAVAGAIMAIGIACYDKDDNEKIKAESYKKTRMLIEEFESLNGKSDCAALLSVDLNSQEGKERYSKEDFKKQKCKKYISDLCNIPDKLL